MWLWHFACTLDSILLFFPVARVALRVGVRVTCLSAMLYHTHIYTGIVFDGQVVVCLEKAGSENLAIQTFFNLVLSFVIRLLLSVPGPMAPININEV